jgi:hypothetical protein
VLEIMRMWDQGDELGGWIAYWHQIYEYVADRIEANKNLSAASKFIVFEDLCANPQQVLSDMFAHCELDVSQHLIDDAAGRIRAPTYYKSGFNDQALVAIAQGTGTTMDRIKALA